ncbi:hypothetical protein [Lewinella sp. W8]|uniref:hypothetical protein n=1 Tax=Lewinella sp. W8 TaxID=2528208 RepID=UPI00106787FD|nr:hypothetical protein [Lewinella sp. W8]MTB49706.1 hypothetical protein [Lewinella sp. W8]
MKFGLLALCFLLLGYWLPQWTPLWQALVGGGTTLVTLGVTFYYIDTRVFAERLAELETFS